MNPSPGLSAAPTEWTPRAVELLTEIRDILQEARTAPPLLMTAVEAAALVGVHERTFRRLVAGRVMPRPVSFGPDSAPMYRRADLADAVAKLKPKRR